MLGDKEQTDSRGEVIVSDPDIGCHFGKEQIQSEREYSNKI